MLSVLSLGPTRSVRSVLAVAGVSVLAIAMVGVIAGTRSNACLPGACKGGRCAKSNWAKTHGYQQQQNSC